MFLQNTSKSGITKRFLNALVTKTIFSARICLKVFASNLRLSKVGLDDKFFKTSCIPLSTVYILGQSAIKGQLISKAIYGLLTSPKKWKDEFVLLFYSSWQTNRICPFVFWENLRLANLLFDLIWPLASYMTTHGFQFLILPWDTYAVLIVTTKEERSGGIVDWPFMLLTLMLCRED